MEYRGHATNIGFHLCHRYQYHAITHLASFAQLVGGTTHHNNGIHRPYYESDPIANIWYKVLKKKNIGPDQKKNVQYCLGQCHKLEEGMITYDWGIEAYQKWDRNTDDSPAKEKKRKELENPFSMPFSS